MSKNPLSRFTKIFHNKTVSDVMAAFEKTLDDLKAVEEAQAEEAGIQFAIAREAEQARKAALDEAFKARTVGLKLSALIHA